MKKLIQRWANISFTLILSLICFSSQAQVTNRINDLVYYEIGGGTAFSGPPSYDEALSITADAELNLGYSCGSFDIRESIESSFDNLADSADMAINAIEYAISNAIAAIPLYILRRADPNLAAMLENMVLRYEEVFNLAVKSCKTAEREILAGKNPFYDWVQWGVANRWREKAREKQEGEEVPIQEALEAADTEPGCVIWIDGDKRMCEEAGFETILVINDVVTHGYEQIAVGGSGSGELGTSDQRLVAVWPSAAEAAEAIQAYIGEYEFADMRETSPSSIAPIGIMPEMFVNAREIKDLLDAAIGQTAVITDAESEAMSVPGLRVTQSLIDALKNLPPTTREPATERIATELALINAMEKVNLARRLILVGSADPVVAVSPAGELIKDEILPRLESESRLLKDEYDIRERISKSAALALIRNDILRDQRNLAPSGGPSTSPIQGGAVGTTP